MTAPLAQQRQQQTGNGLWEGYAPESERPPLGARLALSSGFVAAFTTFLVARRRSGGLPERMEARDLALLSGASFKLGRLISKEKVSAPIRAPFTEYQGKGEAPGEVDERPRGTGPRAAVGELLTCPYCLGMWVVSALTVGLVTVPRETRLVASILSALGVSDFLQVAYRALAARGTTSA
ncbi:MAG: DUF1360 domain-containing protein [Actinomycetota bacterium]|nr:DUF1360 domain-containing protein [Actinomycetota bacterium]